MHAADLVAEVDVGIDLTTVSGPARSSPRIASAETESSAPSTTGAVPRATTACHGLHDACSVARQIPWSAGPSPRSTIGQGWPSDRVPPRSKSCLSMRPNRAEAAPSAPGASLAPWCTLRMV